jgi:hypothetical protein
MSDIDPGGDNLMPTDLQAMTLALRAHIGAIRGLRDERGGGSSSVEQLILLGGAIALAVAIVAIIAGVVKSHAPH